MKILAVSDKVLPQLYSPTVKERYPDVDLLLACGDLPFYYLDFLASAFGKPMYYVKGNHDSGRQYTANRGQVTDVRGGNDLHAQSVMHKDLLIAGLEGSMRYQPRKTQQYSENEMILEVLRLIPRLMWNRVRYGRYLDILITHSPVLGIHDEDDRVHTGFRVFRWLLRFAQPRYMLHGHIHIYGNTERQITQFGKTQIVNVYPYFEFEVE